MPEWKYDTHAIAYAPGLESTQGLGLDMPMYVQEIRLEDGGWITVSRRNKQRKVRRLT
jgi:hypothetical protein